MGPYRNEYGWRGPRGSYYGRGNVKFAILDLLKEKPRHGYDIIREMEERSGGVYTPSPGVIYPTLQALEDQDYVDSVEQDGKKVYSITESGGAYLQGHQERQQGQGHGPGHGAGHGPGRHGEGFRPPFPPFPPFGFGPGPRGYRPEDAEAAGAAGPGASAADPAAGAGEDQAARNTSGAGPAGEERGRGRHGHGGPHGAAWGTWFASSGGPEMMREMRWMFGDVATSIQRTLGDRKKLDEIRDVLRKAKGEIDDIVMRQD